MEEAKLSLFIQNMMVTEKILKTPQKYSQEMAALNYMKEIIVKIHFIVILLHESILKRILNTIQFTMVFKRLKWNDNV